MSRIILVIIMLAVISSTWAAPPHPASAPDQGQIRGAGAPGTGLLIRNLAAKYRKRHPDVQLEFEARGSALGIASLLRGEAQFAGVDASSAEFKPLADRKDYVFIPLAASAVVLVYRLDGVGGVLAIDAATLSEIYLGRISNWSDARIAKLNPGVTLPNKPLIVVVSYPASAVNYVLTSYLSNHDPTWKRDVGVSRAPKWPAGVSAGRSLTVEVSRQDGSLGATTPALAENLTSLSIFGSDSRRVSANKDAILETLDAIDLAKNPRADPTGVNKPQCYPLVAVKAVVVSKAIHGANKNAVEEFKAFLSWSLSEGQIVVEQTGLVPIPPAARDAAARSVQEIVSE